jgi:hypothetical protein
MSFCFASRLPQVLTNSRSHPPFHFFSIRIGVSEESQQCGLMFLPCLPSCQKVLITLRREIHPLCTHIWLFLLWFLIATSLLTFSLSAVSSLFNISLSAILRLFLSFFLPAGIPQDRLLTEKAILDGGALENILLAHYYQMVQLGGGGQIGVANR